MLNVTRLCCSGLISLSTLLLVLTDESAGSDGPLQGSRTRLGRHAQKQQERPDVCTAMLRYLLRRLMSIYVTIKNHSGAALQLELRCNLDEGEYVKNWAAPTTATAVLVMNNIYRPRLNRQSPGLRYTTESLGKHSE